MKNYWLLKSEPYVWSIDQQKKAGSKGATWDGVRNYQAANNLRKMKIGDECFFYHSNEGKEIVGVVSVIKNAFMDKTDKKKKLIDDLNEEPKSRWPLDKFAPYMKGPGLKL